MIVISAGLPKAGTGLYFNLTNDLLIKSGSLDTRVIRDRYLVNILKYYNCNLEKINYSNLYRLLVTNLKVGSFVVKTHEPPIKGLNLLISLNLVKCTCIYRDPRDVVLSAIDHGEKIRQKGEKHSFVNCKTIEETIPIVKGWMDHSIFEWIKIRNILMVKYEDLINDPIAELQRLAHYLDIDTSNDDLAALYSKYDRDGLDSSKIDYLHFNKGVVDRFRSVLPKESLKNCNHHFGHYLERLNYRP